MGFTKRIQGIGVSFKGTKMPVNRKQNVTYNIATVDRFAGGSAAEKNRPIDWKVSMDAKTSAYNASLRSARVSTAVSKRGSHRTRHDIARTIGEKY
jgi:hypothetical protein